MDDREQTDRPDDPQRFGAAAAADAELADRVAGETGGDEDAAEARFEEQQQGPARTVPGGAKQSDG